MAIAYYQSASNASFSGGAATIAYSSNNLLGSLLVCMQFGTPANGTTGAGSGVAFDYMAVVAKNK